MENRNLDFAGLWNMNLIEVPFKSSSVSGGCGYYHTATPYMLHTTYVALSGSCP